MSSFAGALKNHLEEVDNRSDSKFALFGFFIQPDIVESNFFDVLAEEISSLNTDD